MSYGRFPKYVSIAAKKARAEKTIKQLQKENPDLKPVRLKTSALASTWWGKAWNINLERYADYRNRIGRGKSYVRHGAVLDLQIGKGLITALVQGSTNSPYEVLIRIKPLKKSLIKTIQQQSAKQLSSLPDLLAGQFPKELQDIFMVEGKGLFPNPAEICLDCDCPDWAVMCKHVAAALYGVGTRLDEDPALFFSLRNIAVETLVAQAVLDKTANILSTTVQKNSISDDNLADLFGIEMDTGINFTSQLKTEEKRPKKKQGQPQRTSPKNPQSTDLILAIIEEYGEPISVKDLAAISGISPAGIYAILRHLKQQQMIVNPRRGRYGLPS